MSLLKPCLYFYRHLSMGQSKYLLELDWQNKKMTEISGP